MSKLIAARDAGSLLAAKLNPKKKSAPKPRIKKDGKEKKPRKRSSSKTKSDKVYIVIDANGVEPLAVYGSEELAQLRALKEKLDKPAARGPCKIFEAPFVKK